MINTQCPECSAKFYVAENLVAGKVVRFRCRKCGGTITVDGTKSDGSVGSEAEDGTDAALLSRVPPAPADSSRPADAPLVEVKADKGTLRPSAEGSPVPGATLQQLADATGAAQPAEVSVSSEPTQQRDKPGASAAAEPTAVSPGSPKAGAAAAPKPAAAKPTAGSEGSGGKKAEGAKPDASDDGPASGRARLSRISMELQNSVFAVPEDDGVDVAVDMDDAPAYEELDPEPASIHGMRPIVAKPAAPKPPAPKPAVKPPAPKVVTPKPGPIKIELPSPKAAGGKAPAPVPRTSLRAADDDRVDFASVGRLSAEPLSIPSRELLGPVVVSSEEAAAPEAPPVSEKKLAPAVPVALPPMLPEPEAPAEEKKSRTGLYAAIAAVAAVAIIGGGVLIFRSPDSGTNPAAPRTAAPAEPDEAPTATQTTQPAANAPGTGAPTEPATAPPTADTTEKPAETKPAETKPAETKPAETSTRSEPASTAPAATAQPAETKPAATAEAPPKPTETKPAETKPAETAPPPTPPSTAGGDAPFDKGAASAAMGGAKAAAASCKQEGGPQGNASVRVTFAPNGRSTVVSVDGPPFAGTPVGGCIASKFRGLRVPPFSGSPVTVRTTVPIF